MGLSCLPVKLEIKFVAQIFVEETQFLCASHPYPLYHKFFKELLNGRVELELGVLTQMNVLASPQNVSKFLIKANSLMTSARLKGSQAVVDHRRGRSEKLSGPEV